MSGSNAFKSTKVMGTPIEKRYSGLATTTNGHGR